MLLLLVGELVKGFVGAAEDVGDVGELDDVGEVGDMDAYFDLAERGSGGRGWLGGGPG